MVFKDVFYNIKTSSLIDFWFKAVFKNQNCCYVFKYGWFWNLLFGFSNWLICSYSTIID